MEKCAASSLEMATCGQRISNTSAVATLGTTFGKKLAEYDLYILQPIWDLRIGYEEYISSPLYPVITSILFYFMCVIPFMIVDLYGQDWHWIQQYKIQPQKQVKWSHVKHAIERTTWNHIVYILPISMAQWIWLDVYDIPTKAPGLFEVMWQCTASLLVFDFEYWVWHAVHHKIRILYKYIHAVHHEFYSPFSWVTQHLHPFELISIGIFTTTSPWLFGAHPLTQTLFQFWAIIVSVEDHIGYDFPFAMHRFFPNIWGGAVKHDMHHQRPRSNYAPFFCHWDILFGWYCPARLAGGVKSKALEEFDRKRKEKRLGMNFDHDGDHLKLN